MAFNHTEKETNAMSNNSKTNANTIQSACVIVEGTVIEGSFKSTTDTRLDGVLKGNMECTARLIMGHKGAIEGNIRSKQATIAGGIEGELTVEDILSLKSTANVIGKVLAGKLEVEEGAVLNGEVKIGNAKSKSSPAK